MKILLIAKQEWSDKRMVWAAAFMAGLICYAIPGMMGYRQLPLQDGRAIASFSVAFPLAGIMALICGAGMIAPDIQEGRFGFFFSRPVTSFDLFFGKWMGAAMVSLGAGLLVLLPIGLAHAGRELILSCLVPLILIALLGTVVGHAFSTALRARTAWLLLDAATLLLFASEIAWAAQWLSAMNAFWEWGVLIVLALAACTAGLGLIGWRQIASARTDLKGNHRVLSMGAMAMVVLLGLGGWAFVWNALHVDVKTLGPSSLTRAARQGSWIHLMTESWLPRGDGPKGNSNVLLNVDTGRGIRTGSNTRMSADGNRAVWEVSNPFTGVGHEIWMADLGSVEARVRRTGIKGSYFGGQMVLSPDGRKLATIENTALVVYDLDTGVLIARGPVDSAELLNPWRNSFLFIGSDTLRCYVRASASTRGEDTISIREMDLQNGRIRETGTINLPGKGWTVLMGHNPSLESLLVSRTNEKSRQIYLCDARTGAIKQVLAPEGETPLFHAEFLSDGSIAMAGVTGWESGSYWIKHFDPAGRELCLIHVGTVPKSGPELKRYIQLGAETKPGVVVLRTSESQDSRTNAHQQFEVDFKTNTAREMSDQGWEPSGSSEDLLGPVIPGSLPTRLRVRQGGVVSIREGNRFSQITIGRIGPPEAK